MLIGIADKVLSESMTLFQEVMAKQCSFDSYDSGRQALLCVPAKGLDLLFLRTELCDMSGCECAAKFKLALPRLPIIMFSATTDARLIMRCFVAGVSGYFLLPVSIEDLLLAVGRVLEGSYAFSQYAQDTLLKSLQLAASRAATSALSLREREVMTQIASGLQDKEIADALFIGQGTVHTHISKIFKKLGAHSRQEAVRNFLLLT